MRGIPFLFCILLLIPSARFCSAKEWRGIVPLHSTRADVERLLGKSDIHDGPPTYYLPDETVSIFYSENSCGDKLNFDKWNVPPGTVLIIGVEPRAKIRLRQLQLDLRDFKKKQGMYVIGQLSYVNEAQGFAVSVWADAGKERVSAYFYGPAASDNYLHCAGYSDQEQEAKQGLGQPCVRFSMFVECSSENIRPEAPVQCNVDARLHPDIQRSYKWTVADGGAILSGKNTDKVEVSLTDPSVKTITVTVEINLNRPCLLNTASYELKVTPKKASRKHRFTRRKHKPGPATSLATGKPNTE